MKLHDQRDRLLTSTAEAERQARELYSALTRKMSMPYGDGSRSNMVNAETDVLPRLFNLISTLDDAQRDLETA